MTSILIIEDEAAYIKLLSSKLSNKYKVLTATDGREGLEIAKKEKPDLILLDIMLPEIGGLQVLKELRRDNYGKKAKVIMLTNLDTDNKILQQIVEYLPVYYFIKSDIKMNDLLEKIDELFQENSQ